MNAEQKLAQAIHDKSGQSLKYINNAANSLVKQGLYINKINALEFMATLSQALPNQGRYKAFEELGVHAHYAKLYKRLSNDELLSCERFILANLDLSKDEYCKRVNRIGISGKDAEISQAKNSAVMIELLLVAGTST